MSMAEEDQAAVETMADGNNDRVMVEYKADGDAESGTVQVVSPGTPLTPVHRRNSRIPILFERASKSWWDPKFDSSLLEQSHKKISLPQIRKRFQYALSYIILSCIAWCIYFAVMQRTSYWIYFLSGCVVLVVIAAVVLGFSFTKMYERYTVAMSVLISLVVCVFCLLYYIRPEEDMSAVGAFTGTIEILLMMYTVIPLPLYLCVGLGVLHSVIFELLSGFLTNMYQLDFVLARAFIHVCVHLIGIHIFIMAQVRKRSTFIKVGESIVLHQELKLEKSLKQQMIHSLMPPPVAEEVLKSRNQEEQRDEDMDDYSSKPPTKGPSANQFNFRQFHMDQMTDVSILFADIVGFTKMSSNKTAEHLVSLLNDLFGRFDVICVKSGCEKISTLGDCYYAVSGCPKPRPDHASCCVEMGMAMCTAIEEFDEEHNEEVDMRVGVHTGMVLCGLVGTVRFKFDVWSHDVQLANTMESSGTPKHVHISDATYAFVKDQYVVEPDKEIQDIRSKKVLTECFDPETQQYVIKHVEESNVIKTWLIKGRKESAIKDFPDMVENDTKPDKPDVDMVQITINEEISTKNEESCNDVVESKEEAVDNKPDGGKATNHLDTSHSPQPLPADNVLPITNVDVTEHLHDLDLDLDLASADCDSLLPPPSPDNNNIKVDPELSTASLLGKRVASSTEDLEHDTKDGMALREGLRVHGQTDKELINRINEEYDRAVQYLYKPPINQCTLQFTENKLERKYQRHYLEGKDAIRTLALPKFSAFFDIIVSFLFFILVSVCCFLTFETTTVWLVVFVIAVLLEFIVLLPLCCITCSMATSGRLSHYFTSWSIRHVFGCLVASLPSVAVYANFSCTMASDTNTTLFYGILLVASLLHYCNFTMLSSWMKSTIATVAGLVLLILWAIDICDMGTAHEAFNNVTEASEFGNTTDATSTITGLTNMKHEIILNIILFLFLVWFLNREFEISYRLSFHGDQNALKDRMDMQREKEQADWLLHNIIPEHVSDILKKTSKYCENHQDVGVIFASVTNFDNFYDESFEGGKEYLRVLNEMMGDFEELFDLPKYKDIEKIKTIGSCLMAASGLNPHTRKQNSDPNCHLYALMEFCMELLQKLEDFNAEIFNFDFCMKIGFNYGPVTSGVIGTTKLLYDIWGDTVNISSRMYSTGLEGKIQVTEFSAKKLEEKFEFEYRGKIFVKGKGDMSTYILVRKKPDASWE